MNTILVRSAVVMGTAAIVVVVLTLGVLLGDLTVELRGGHSPAQVEHGRAYLNELEQNDGVRN